jgi:NAD(P)H-hydrate epimerase
MKFFSTSQIRELDQYTIKHEPIASIDLMERAADALYWEFIGNFPYRQPVCIFAGPGNNGGDALALARMLLKSGYDVSAFLIHSGSLSPDCETNRQRLVEKFPDSLIELTDKFINPEITDETIIIDGLFGSGLSRPLTGIFAEAVQWINNADCEVVSIDIPSGLKGEDNTDLSKPIVKAYYTFTLQFPKLTFLFAENAAFVGNWEIIDIGIHPEAIRQSLSKFFYLEETDIAPLLKKRTKFSHKGTFGHALIVAGSKGMAGSSVLSAKAALRVGAGLVTVHGPECNRAIVQTAIPEAILQSDIQTDFISEVQKVEKYNAIAIGPGIGMHEETAVMLKNLLKELDKPCILDADALNIIGQHKDLLQFIPNNSIITPHPKEFERIFGESKTSYERMLKTQEKAKLHGIIIVLKGAHTLIATPDGGLFFNSTGNSGMSTAGSGDVLTGILAGLLAQGYTPEETAQIGVFLHGRAGDLALEKESEESLIAGDIIDYLGKAFKTLKNNK